MIALLLLVDRAIAALSRAALGLSAVAVIALLLIGAVDRLSTEFLLLPIPSAIEFQQAIEASMIFLALAGVQMFDSHIKIDILSETLGPKFRSFSQVFGLVVVAVFLGLLSVQSYLFALRSWNVGERSSGRVDFPLYYFKMLVFAGLVIALLEALRQLVRIVATGRPTNS